MTLLELLAFSPAVLAFGLGGLTLASNRRRRPNQAAAAVFFTVAAWGTARGLATLGVPLAFRSTMALGALLPASLGWLTASLIEPEAGAVWRRCRWIALASAPLLLVPWLDAFTPYVKVPGRIVNGPAYYFYLVWALGLYGVLAVQVGRGLDRVTGRALLELQGVTLSFVTVAVLIVLKMALQPWLPVAVRHYASPIIMLTALAGMAWVIFTRRVFDAHYLIRLACRYVILVLALTTTGWIIHRLIEDLVPDWLMFVAIAMAVLALGHSLRAQLDRWLLHFPASAAARAVLHTAAHQTSTEADFRRELQNIVAGWARSDGAELVSLAEEEAAAAGDEGVPPALALLRRLEWATPDRMDRERPSAAGEALIALLQRRRWGVLVVARGATSTVAIGVGHRAMREPFTHPDVEQLTEFAEIAESAMERLRLTAGIVQSEKLATVGLLGASLAHEIRNPLYAIRTFVELLPANYDRTEFREQFTGLVGSEVVRIDHLISQLMNLASPRPVEARRMSLHGVVRLGCELLSPKARAHGVTVETDLAATRDEIVADVAALKQVLLNLGLNAVHAQEHTATRRWVRIATRDAGDGVELIVSDGGPGIAPEIRARLFEPFQSTHPGGLGLGLSVTRSTLEQFGATIAAEASAAGGGAVFRVRFPRAAAERAARDHDGLDRRFVA